MKHIIATVSRQESSIVEVMNSYPGRDLPPGGLGEVVDFQFFFVSFECFGGRWLQLLLLFELLRTVTKLSVDFLGHLLPQSSSTGKYLHILASTLIQVKNLK